MRRNFVGITWKRILDWKNLIERSNMALNFPRLSLNSLSWSITTCSARLDLALRSGMQILKAWIKQKSHKWIKEQGRVTVCLLSRAVDPTSSARSLSQAVIRMPAARWAFTESMRTVTKTTFPSRPIPQRNRFRRSNLNLKRRKTSSQYLLNKRLKDKKIKRNCRTQYQEERRMNTK